MKGPKPMHGERVFTIIDLAINAYILRELTVKLLLKMSDKEASELLKHLRDQVTEPGAFSSSEGIDSRLVPFMKEVFETNTKYAVKKIEYRWNEMKK